MKIIVAGSRSFDDWTFMYDKLSESGLYKQVTEHVSGRQRSYHKNTKTFYGADYFGELIAIDNDIPVKQFPADWDKFGKGAGHIRNGEMAEYADALIAFYWGEESPGTTDMINKMKKMNKPVEVYMYGNG